MNRSWIAKLSRVICPAIVGTILVTAWATANAANLGTLILEGRKQGTTDWLRNITVLPGDVIEYRVLADMAPVGATNGTNTITAASTPANSGFNALSLAIAQDAAAPIQVDFRAPLSDPNNLSSFRNGWADGVGASAGTPTPRAAGSQNDNMMGIRPIHAAGVFTGFEPAEVVLSGSTFAVVTAPLGGSTVLSPTWGTASGSLRINGTTNVFITTTGQAGADPLVGFSGLTLQAVPEPSTIALIGIGLIGLVAVARRRRA